MTIHPQPRDERYLDREALCARYHISRATSYRYEKDGLIPRAVRLGPGILRWSLRELEEFEQRAAADRGARP